MTRIYWDTMLFIYWLEGSSPQSKRVGSVHRSMQERGDELCTSVFTLGEVLTKPYQRQAGAAVKQIKADLAPPLVRLIPLSAEVADRYAQVRARHRVSPADAIHLASAASIGANLFLTNDRALTRLTVEGIDFIAPLDVSLL